MAPLPTPPVVAVEQPWRAIPEVATNAEPPLQKAFAATGEPELWFGPWLPRPGRFPMVAVDATKLAPFGAPVTLPAIDVPDEALADALAENLGELEPRTRLLIERLVGHVGAARARALYERTRHIENAGGIRVHDRRRTSGGVFLSLVEQQIGGRAFLQASVLAALTVGILPMPPKKRKR